MHSKCGILAGEGPNLAVTHAHLMTLAEWKRGAAWRHTLQHSCAVHRLIWITRGQGLASLQGQRRGVGVHNAIVIPADSLFSLDLGKQGFGLVCVIPTGGPLLMPEEPVHLRVRDAQMQTELTAILEGMQREQNQKRPFLDEVLNAQASLATVWLRRALIEIGPDTDGKETAAIRLVRAYGALIARDFRTGRTMADYAAALGVTPTHLTRSCRQISGLSAAEMLTERTLHAARDLLEQPERPVQQIAGMLGFNSAAYFSRFILHHTGQTPSALRKRAAEPPTHARQSFSGVSG